MLIVDAQMLRGDVDANVRNGMLAERQGSDDGARTGLGDDVEVAGNVSVDEPYEADGPGTGRWLRGI